MPTLDLPQGKKLTYREEGDGPPLLLVHGSPGDSRSWGRVAPHLRDRFRVLAVDLPGYGGSDGVPDEPVGRAALMGAAVARLAESCGQPVRLAGHSYGGVVAVQAALQAVPGTVERLALFEPVFFRALQLMDDRAALDPAAAHFEDYAGRAIAGEPAVVRLMIDYWFGEGAFTRMPEPVRGYLEANAPRNALDVRSSFNDVATAEQLRAFDHPVLVAYGDRSPEIVQAIGRGLMKLLPNARMEALAGANHGMLDSHPEAVARLIAS
ncbi:alpha/beta hydrolase [Reyranella sp.]|uniref:alpha/beta fold hydrolase n=1 Tax=Reyranella sp. TaxID=1929291 RepID=UPI0012283E3B|nr:alpha/beta hydrolase [Reyranella sp.]TAJ84153.1 MAG: alpha/beta hydrolase [Reyranella sp.]